MTDDLAEAKRHIRALIEFIDKMSATCNLNGLRPAAYSAAKAFLDAEGQTVEGSDEDERRWLVYYHDKEVPPELFVRGENAEECARKRHANQLGAWSCHLFREVFPGEQVASGAELTRLKAAQPEHGRTVRLATLEEAACAIDAAERPESGFHPFIINGFEHAIADAVGIVRALKDQTGGEGGI